MKIQRFEIAGLAQYSYMVSFDGLAAVLDPIRDVDRYILYAEEHGLKIAYVLETHIHADFASGSSELAERTGAVLALSGHDKGEHYQYSMPHHDLFDRDTIDVGALRIQVLHTPGHTPEHLSFLVTDPASTEGRPGALLSGDFLFVGSVGRPDLLGEDAKLRLARELHRSLTERIARLPDNVEIFPGHGAGSLCGSGMGEQAETTLGHERVTNPMFQISEDEFIDTVLNTLPPTPTYYPRMKELNARGAAKLLQLPGSAALNVEEVDQLIRERDAVVLDLRSPEAFGGAHIPGAINIGAGQNLSLWAGWLLDPAKPIVLVSEGAVEEESLRALVRVGLDGAVGQLASGIGAWIDAGLNLARITGLSLNEVVHHVPEALIVDVRSDEEWRQGHIHGAMHVMLGDLLNSLEELPQDRPLITVCGSGYRSSIAASLLARSGFSEVSSMLGGMAAWNRRQLPLED